MSKSPRLAKRLRGTRPESRREEKLARRPFAYLEAAHASTEVPSLQDLSLFRALAESAFRVSPDTILGGLVPELDRSFFPGLSLWRIRESKRGRTSMTLTMKTGEHSSLGMVRNLRTFACRLPSDSGFAPFEATLKEETLHTAWNTLYAYSVRVSTPAPLGGIGIRGLFHILRNKKDTLFFLELLTYRGKGVGRLNALLVFYPTYEHHRENPTRRYSCSCEGVRLDRDLESQVYSCLRFLLSAMREGIKE